METQIKENQGNLWNNTSYNHRNIKVGKDL